MMQLKSDSGVLTVYLVIIIVFLSALAAFWDLVGVLIVSASFAFVLMPLQNRMKLKTGRGISAALITIAVALCISAAFYITAVVTIQNSEFFFEMMNSVLLWLNSVFIKGDSVYFSDPFMLTADFFLQIIADAEEWALKILSMAPMIAIKVIILFLSIYLFLVFGADFYSSIRLKIPESAAYAFNLYEESLSDMLYAVFNVHIAVAVIVFLLSFPVFYILGYGHILFFAVLSTILALIPVFGPVILIAFLALYAVSISDWEGLLIIIIVAWPLLCAIPDWWLRPVLMGKRAKINGVLMFIAFFGGIAVMGILGFIMGPIFVALMIASYRIITGTGPDDMESKCG